MISMELWAEIRSLRREDGLSIRAIAHKLGLARNTVREVLRSTEPPEYRRGSEPSKLDPFKVRIAELLGPYPRLSAVRSLGDSEGRGIRRGNYHPS